VRVKPRRAASGLATGVQLVSPSARPGDRPIQARGYGRSSKAHKLSSKGVKL
jgi:hypothetical protein